MSENVEPKIDIQSLMLPILQILGDGEERSHKELVDKLVQKLELTDEQRLRRHAKSGVNVFDNNVSWAVTHFHKANLITRPRKAWLQVTETGQALLETKPDHINLRLLKDNYECYVQGWKTTTTGNEDNGNESEPELDTSELVAESLEERFEEIYLVHINMLKEDLLEVVKKIDDHEFEKFAVQLLETMGYGVGRVTQRSRDGGIDGSNIEDELGFNEVYIQAKKYTENRVGEPAIRDFIGAINNRGNGVFITTSSFTPEAISKAAEATGTKIVLIDGKRLVELMVKYNFGVRSMSPPFEIKKIDDTFFNEKYGVVE